MAENITQTTVLNVETSQSVKSVKDLKQQIKDLKDKIVELNAAGEDTTAEFAELGTLMRQYKDINEEAKRSSKDLGDQLATYTGTMKGVAGAISTVTGVMGLMGVESEKGTKLLKTMAAAMSITSGIQAMESGYKAVKSLIGGFAVAAKGAKTMGQAIKAAFSSNPIGLLLVALTTVIGLMSKMRSEAEQLREEMEKQDERMSAMAGHIKDYFTDAFDTAVKTSFDDMERLLKAEDKLLDEQYKIAEKEGTMVMRQTQGLLEMSINSFKHQRQIALESNPAWDYTAEGQKAFRAYYADLMELSKVKFRDIRLETGKEAEKLRQQIVDEYNKANDELKKYNKAVADYNKTKRDEAKAATKDRAAQLKQQIDLEKKNIADQLKLEQVRAKRLYDLDVETATKKLKNGEISQKEYNETILALDNQYYTEAQNQLQRFVDSMNALKDKYKDNKLISELISEDDRNNIFPESALETYLQQIDDLRRTLAEKTQEFNTNKLTEQFAQTELQKETDKQTKLNEITENGLKQRYEIEQKYNSDRLLAFNDFISQEKELIQLDMEAENARYSAISENLQNQIQLMQQKKESGLISEMEYNQGMAELNQQEFENEQEHTEQLNELERRRKDVKKQTLQAVAEAEKAMANATVQVLNGLADHLGEENENYKGLKIAAALIDTIQGAISAFTAAQSIPPPYGQIVGAINAAAVTAMGMMNIAKIKQINARDGQNSGATPSTNSVQTFTTPTTATIATGATNDFTDMMGNAVEQGTQNTKVYVLLNDINEAESRRATVQNSNTY